jgi:hypothetical protein
MIKRTSAAVAVTAFGVVLGAGSAFATDSVPCGTPAVDAVYRTVVSPAVPAVTHVEYQWALWETATVHQWRRWVVDVPGQEAVYRVVQHPATYETVVVTPARDAWDERVLVSQAWTEEILVQEAVYVTEYEFVHRHGDTRWRDDPNWNANDNEQSNGWTRTQTPPRETLVSAPVYRYVEHEAVYDTIHHSAVDAVTEQREVTAAWEERVLVTDAVEEEGHWDYRWRETEPAGQGWEKTGESRDGEPEVVDHRWAVESPGEGWLATGLERQVVDTEEKPATTTKELVSPAVPAGPPCAVTPTKPVTNPAPAKPAKPAEPVEVPALAASAVPAATQASVDQLPHTGSDLTLLWLGAGTLLVGIGASAAYRKAAREVAYRKACRDYS